MENNYFRFFKKQNEEEEKPSGESSFQEPVSTPFTQQLPNRAQTSISITDMPEKAEEEQKTEEGAPAEEKPAFPFQLTEQQEPEESTAETEPEPAEPELVAESEPETEVEPETEETAAEPEAVSESSEAQEPEPEYQEEFQQPEEQPPEPEPEPEPEPLPQPEPEPAPEPEPEPEPEKDETPSLSDLMEKKKAFRPIGYEKTYLDSLVKLVNASSGFLESMKESKLKSLSFTKKGRVDEMLKRIEGAELGFVSEMAPDFKELETEITRLISKFRIIKDNYKDDATLQNFLGDYKSDSIKAYKKLIKFIDASVAQIDTVITAYSKVLRDMNKPRRWITTVFSHYSSNEVLRKAKEANEVLKDLEKLIGEIRSLVQDAKYDLVSLRATLVRAAGLGKEEEE